MGMEYTNNLDAAASLDVFDIHLMESFEKMLKEKEKNKRRTMFDDNVSIPTDSFMLKYFVKHLFQIVELPKSEIFTKGMEFKRFFVRKLAQDSIEVNTQLEKYKSSHVKSLSGRSGLIAGFYQFFKWVNCSQC